MSFELGQTVGEYEFIDVVSSSRSSIAYRVRNTLVQRFELLRVLRHVDEDPAKRERFLREIKVLARLQHPNIVGFFHATQLAGELVLTTELTEGSTLAERIEVGRVPIAEALEYMDEVLAALDYAHGQGIIHRDITPENIILTPDANIKLTGFGLAKSLSDPQLTQAGTMLGSLSYMSPEQIQGLPTIDARTDIYAAGVILYQMVTGKNPFAGHTQFEVMFANVNAEPAPACQENAEVPVELSDLILAAMDKDPARRPTAAEFRRGIASLMRPGVAGDQQHPVPLAAIAPPSSSSMSDLVWAGVVMFAFGVAIFFTIVHMR